MSATALTTGVLAVGVTTVFTGHNYINSIQVFGDGVNAATVNVYDNTTNSGKIVAKITLPAATAGLTYNSVVFVKAPRFDIGLTVEVIGTGATAIVAYGAA